MLKNNFFLTIIFFTLTFLTLFYYAERIQFKIFVRNIKKTTFVTIPKNMGNATNIYELILPFNTWLLSCPSCPVLLLGDKNKIDINDEIINFLRNKYPFADVNIYNLSFGVDDRPLIRSWFLTGIEKTKTELVAFLNADIMVEEDFTRKLLIVHNNVKKMKEYNGHILYLTDKSFTQWRKTLDHVPTPSEYNDFIQITPKYGRWGADIFIFEPSKPPIDFETWPDFVVGFPAWDVCLMGNAMNDKRKNVLTVALNQFIVVFHLQHKKVWDAGKNKSKKVKQMCAYVQRLAKPICKDGFVFDCKYMATRDGGVKFNGSLAHYHPNYFLGI